MAVSQNGYPANNISLTHVKKIPGTTRELRVRKGPAGDLLIWVAAQFHKRVEKIDGGQLDDWGYAERPIRGSQVLSNHASGTAIDLNAPKHPLGVSGTFSAAQVREIHKILREAQGCVRWGGDYIGRKDEMHFEIVASEAACRKALQKVEKTTPDWWETVDDKKFVSLVRKAMTEGFQIKKLTDGKKTDLRVLVQWIHKHVTDIKGRMDSVEARLKKLEGDA